MNTTRIPVRISSNVQFSNEENFFFLLASRLKSQRIVAEKNKFMGKSKLKIVNSFDSVTQLVAKYRHITPAEPQGVFGFHGSLNDIRASRSQ